CVTSCAGGRVSGRTVAISITITVAVAGLTIAIAIAIAGLAITVTIAIAIAIARGARVAGLVGRVLWFGHAPTRHEQAGDGCKHEGDAQALHAGILAGLPVRSQSVRA